MESVYISVGNELIQFVQLFRNPFFDQVFLTLTRLGEAPFILTAAALVSIFYKPARWLGPGMVLVFILASVLNAEIKDALDVPRPGSGVDTLQDPGGNSTPSAHTMIATAVWVFLALMLPKGWWRPALLAVPVVVGFSRIYLGVHYPGDVALGMALGAIIAVCIQALMRPSHDSPLVSPAYAISGYLIIGLALLEIVD